MPKCFWPGCDATAPDTTPLQITPDILVDCCGTHKQEIESVILLYGNFYFFKHPKTGDVSPVHPTLIAFESSKQYMVKKPAGEGGLSLVAKEHIIKFKA